MTSTLFTTIAPYLATFLAGFFFGYILRLLQERVTRKNDFEAIKATNATEEIVMIAIVGVWIISMITSLVAPNREVPLAVHLLMGSVVGYLFKKGNPILQGLVKGVTIDKEDGNKTTTNN